MLGMAPLASTPVSRVEQLTVNVFILDFNRNRVAYVTSVPRIVMVGK